MSEEGKTCKVCKYTEDEYYVEITEGEVCDGCRKLNEQFQIYRILATDGVIDSDATHEWVDFSDDVVEKYPILKKNSISGEWHLQQSIERQLDRCMNGRMRDYKIKSGKSVYGRSTATFKRDDKKRKAPLVSATCFDIGDMMPGCKRMGMRGSYIVKVRKDGTHFWAKASHNDMAWRKWVAKNYITSPKTFIDESAMKSVEEIVRSELFE